MFKEKKKDVAWDGFPFSFFKELPKLFGISSQEKSNQIGKRMKPGGNVRNILAPTYSLHIP